MLRFASTRVSSSLRVLGGTSTSSSSTTIHESSWEEVTNNNVHRVDWSSSPSSSSSSSSSSSEGGGGGIGAWISGLMGEDEKKNGKQKLIDLAESPMSIEDMYSKHSGIPIAHAAVGHLFASSAKVMLTKPDSELSHSVGPLKASIETAQTLAANASPTVVPIRTAHGKVWIDPWAWMAASSSDSSGVAAMSRADVVVSDDSKEAIDDLNTPLITYLAAETELTEQMLQNDFQALVPVLAAELVARLPPTDASDSASTEKEVVGPWTYATIPDPNGWSTITQRTWTGPPEEAPEESVQAIVDQKLILEVFPYVMGEMVVPSPDGNHIAYTLDLGGSERFCAFIRDMTPHHNALPAWKGVVPAPGGVRTAGVVPGGGGVTEELNMDHIGAVQPGERIGEVLGHVRTIAWSPDSKVLYYTAVGADYRPWQVWRHVLGTDPGQDKLLFEDRDPSAFIHVSLTSDKRWLVITSATKSSSGVSALDPHLPLDEQEVITIKENVADEFCFADHVRDSFLLCTSTVESSNLRVMTVGDENVSKGPSHWRPFLGSNSSELLEDVDLLKQAAVLYGTRHSLQFIRLAQHESNAEGGLDCVKVQDVNLDQVGGAGKYLQLSPSANMDPSVKTVSVRGSSLTHPGLAFDLDVETGETFQVDSTRLGCSARGLHLRSYRPEDYIEQMVWVQANEPWPSHLEPVSSLGPDNRPWIPMFLAYHRSAMDRASIHSHSGHGVPTMLIGYGAYGVSADRDFLANTLPLLDRGWVVATAGVRGGSDLGRQWYRAGSQELKEASFADFEDCARALMSPEALDGRTRPQVVFAGADGAPDFSRPWCGGVDEGLPTASPSTLIGHGSSAGGLLVGATVARDPELWAAVHLHAPFVDCLTAMLDGNLRLTAHEYDEWGDPASNPSVADAMFRYDPYFNLGGARGDSPDSWPLAATSFVKSWPNMMINTVLKDVRVPIWSIAKYTAKIRALCDLAVVMDKDLASAARSKLFVNVDMVATHASGSGRVTGAEERAKFIAWMLGQVPVDLREEYKRRLD